MPHASEEYRYSTRNYKTCRVLAEALEMYIPTTPETAWWRERAVRELDKITKLVEKRRDNWK